MKNVCEDCENYRPKEEKDKTNSNRLKILKQMREKVGKVLDIIDPVTMTEFCGLITEFECYVCPLEGSGCRLDNISVKLYKLRDKLDREIKGLE